MTPRIPVIWHAQEDSRGYYGCTAMLNDLFDHYGCGPHYPGRGRMPAGLDGAVIVVHGGRELGGLDKLNLDLQKFTKWAFIICLGDEECSFPIEKVEHPNKIVWIQEPMPGRHDFADRYIIDGYAHDHWKHIVQCEKDLDWFFGGQITHDRRLACVNALRTIDWGGIVIETRGYFQGISFSEYYRTLCRAKIVPCPSGPFSPDAARPWDALECGAIPILDDLSPTRPGPGFWSYVLGSHPLPVIRDWSLLPTYIKEIKANYEHLQPMCMQWWSRHKSNFKVQFAVDLMKLQEKAQCTKD